MARFCPLSSSSAGNSALVSCSSGALLIDAGISCRRICEGLQSVGAAPEDIGAVLITHEHIDHIKGLAVWQRKRPTPVYATAPVLEYLLKNGYITDEALLRPVSPGEPFEAAGMRISAFATPHDARQSVGYRITTQDGCSIGFATDMGQVTDEVLHGVSGCTLVLLEANYDKKLLEMGSYPWHLKQRIASDVGHLENARSAELAVRLVRGGTTRLILAHLSRENNDPALAHRTVADALCAAGAQQGHDFLLDVAPYDGAGRLVRL